MTQLLKKFKLALADTTEEKDPGCMPEMPPGPLKYPGEGPTRQVPPLDEIAWGMQSRPSWAATVGTFCGRRGRETLLQTHRLQERRSPKGTGHLERGTHWRAAMPQMCQSDGRQCPGSHGRVLHDGRQSEPVAMLRKIKPNAPLCLHLLFVCVGVCVCVCVCVGVCLPVWGLVWCLAWVRECAFACVCPMDSALLLPWDRPVEIRRILTWWGISCYPHREGQVVNAKDLCGPRQLHRRAGGDDTQLPCLSG